MKPASPIMKVLISASAFSLICHAGLTQAAVSQQPLMLVESVAPNLIFTLDSSGSMRWAFAPDNIGINNANSSQNALRNSRRAKSSTFNPLYYNPEVTYRLPVKLNNDGTPAASGYTTSFTNAYHNGYQTSHGSVNLSNSYRVAWNWDINSSPNYSYNSTTDYRGSTGHVYNLAENPASDFNTWSSNRTRTGVPAYYYVYDESRSGCDNSIDNDSCYRKVDVNTSERQNFAIWYSFYRTRALATLTAANLAFNDLPSSIRFTWQDLDRCQLNDSNCENNYFRTFTDRHKGNFFKWLANVDFSTSTPLRKALDDAGKFLRTNDAWAYNPNPMTSAGGRGSTVQSPEYSCRPSFHVMMSDGMWNGANGDPSGTLRADHSSFSLPGIGNYTSSRRPYGDSTTNTLADLAMHYWATDLRPNLDNDVKPYMPFKGPNENWDPRNNPATWQHMVNYTMGLGLSQSLTQNGLTWEGDTFSGGYENLVNGSRSWPAAAADSGNNVYDLWHAAINSRGEFFSVDRPEDMIQAFNDIINRIAERTATAAAAGSAPSTIDNEPDQPLSFTTKTKAYFPEYNSEDWSGDVKQAIITRLPDGTHSRTLGWSASDVMNTQGTRNIYMAGDTGTTDLREFTYNNLSNTLKTIFDRNPDSLGSSTDSRGADRVAYIKGSRAAEGSASNQFRRRTSLLGDIINSQPAVVGTPAYLPYLADKIDGNPGDYLRFQQKYSTSAESPNRRELIYVGANDGMLHALSADTGAEVFAFVPSAVLQHMPKLAGQTYAGGGHRFFVDGSPIVRDVYINNEWRTVLVGTLRAGGKSVFALDITEPGTDGSGVKLLWEITDASPDYENLGYSFPEPEIVRLHSGEWAVLQANGYESADGVASLFIIDIADGNLIKEVVAENGESGANGLSGVRGADNNGDGIVDYAYAGDLQGNLWRFDLSRPVSATDGDPFARSKQTGVSTGDYKVSYGGKPLYQAAYSNGNIQPITAPPSLVRHPTRRGYLAIVGTGKYFETDDAAPDTTKAHSVYAVWDRLTRGQATTSVSPGNLTRANLQQQRIVEEKVTSFSGDTGSTSWTLRYLTDNPVGWYKDGTSVAEEDLSSRVQTWGWYVDLEVGSSKKGEMMIQRMSARGDTLLFSTLTPNEDPCADGAGYWAYGINAHTGARTKHPMFDFNRDGVHDRKDTDDGTTPSGFSTDSPITVTNDGIGIDISGGVGISFTGEPAGRDSWQTMPLEAEEE
ncbi:PilC/PilY family type IV pilus protein [Halopseudomonas sp. SMJS2]|uniref:pilus assembly protein n=1 Tax=Halopseudomonas sp. SMJS2 TaxID=3041098 RepID=UPI00245348BC|nr:PilC/PilY family type IV pilus protein [Halopseudomonas sp. SMJS2]WGK60982.1 PilC/PilY family type IV pilus protein [Halopseudomonas sp. SMJS2]